MSDTGTDPGTGTAEGSASPPSPGQPQRRSSWPRIGGYFTPEWLTTVFTIVLAGATVALVWASIEQHRDAVEAIETTKRLAQATENAASGRQQIASADFIFKINAMLEDHRYEKIVDDIQSHNSDYRLPKYPSRADAGVEEYIGLFEDVGYFIAENLIAAKMAYDHFSYDIEKAWCNVSVRETIEQARATDRSKTAHSDPLYGNFEKLAKEYLDNEGQTCKDLDTAPAVARAQMTRKRP
jgi:hypothetical protein